MNLFGRILFSAVALPLLAAPAAGQESIDRPGPLPNGFDGGFHAQPRTVNLLLEALDRAAEEGDSPHRQRLLTDLGACRSRLALVALRSALADEDPAIRQVAVRGLGQMPLPLVRDALRGALADADPSVAWRAWLALEPTATAEDVDWLTAHAGERSAEQRMVLLQMLDAVDSPQYNAVLLEALMAGDRLGGLLWRPRVGTPIDDALAEALRLRVDQGGTMDLLALVGYARLRPEDAQPMVAELAESEDYSGRATAARAAAHTGQQDLLLALLDDVHTYPRTVAIAMQQQVRDPRAVGPLVQLLTKGTDPTTPYHHLPVAYLSTAAAEALGAFDPDIAAEAVAEAMQREDVSFIHAARALAAMDSPLAAEARLEHLAAVNHDDPTLVYYGPTLASLPPETAVPAIDDYLDRALPAAEAYYRQRLNPSPTTPAFHEPSLAGVLRGVPAGAGQAGVDLLRRIVEFRSAGSAMTEGAVTSAVDTLARIGSPQAQQLIALVAGDGGYSSRARYAAALALGDLKSELPAARSALDTILQDRPSWELVTAAAWALQEITGQAAELPDPQYRDPYELTVQNDRR